MGIWVKVIAVTVLLGLLGTAFKFTYDAGEAACELENAKALQEKQREWQEKYDEQEEQLDLLQASLEKEKANIKVRTRTLTQKVKVYVKDDARCNLNRGAVRVLNSAWADSGGDALPKDTVLTQAEASQASTVTQSALAEKYIEYGGYCAELEKRFDALVAGAEKLGY